MTTKTKTVEAVMKYDLNETAAALLQSEPFFAAMSRRINKIANDAVGTAGVRVNPRTYQFEMLYSPKFMFSLTNEQRLAVIKHELYHLIFGHVTDRKPADDKLAKLWNIAADLAINSHLPELPEFCCFPGKGPFKDFGSGESAEWYFKKLLEKQQEQQKQNGNGQGSGGEGSGDPSDQWGEGQFDKHEDWNQSGSGEEGEDGQGRGSGTGDLDDDAVRERIREMTRKAVNEAQSTGWGSISAQCKKEIIDRIRVKVNWRSVLRYFIKTSQRADKSSTVRRINKRYAYIHPGKRVNRVARIAISIDQSGSVSDVLLTKFFAALDDLAKLAEFVVIPFDHEVAEEAIYTWKKGQRHAAERVRCGGTDFNPPSEYVNRRNFDGHIILTDLEAPAPVPSRCQRMWMTDQQHKERPYFTTREVILAVD